MVSDRVKARDVQILGMFKLMGLWNGSDFKSIEKSLCVLMTSLESGS